MATSLVTEYSPKEWKNLVHLGQELVDSESTVQFRLGDIGLELVPLPPKGRHLPMKAYKMLADYADEVGLTRQTFEGYRLVAGAWPKDKRQEDVCWTVHSILSYRHDRFELILDPPVHRKTGRPEWTCAAAQRVMGWKTDVPETEDERLQMVEDLLNDEQVAAKAVERVMSRKEVARRVVERPAVRESFNRAQTERIVEAHEQTKKRPEIRRINEQAEVYSVLHLCSDFTHGIGRALPTLHVAQLSEDAKDSIREGLQRVTAAVSWTEHALDTGSTDIDSALERLLAE
ncbi:DUF6192 family protein [Kitasatospora sp. NPDC087315]|uniref:DUF6192 family protein n=1 Tax=Kitasatospora sp. NPDC087315 TaxID=3364069 RepID=UPI00382C05C4